MSSIREQIILAAVLALNTGAPSGVPAVDRGRGLALEPSNLPSGVLVPTREWVIRIGKPAGPLVHRRLRLALVWRAARPASPDTAGPDSAIDPLSSWASKALVDNSLGGLAFKTEEVEGQEPAIVWEYELGEKFFCKADQLFDVHYTTRVADAELRV